MIRIWWVEDFLSGQVLENKYYSEKQEAVDRRNELGYGMVKCWETHPDGKLYEIRGGTKTRIFPD